MSRLFARTNRGLLSQWWWTVDRQMVGGVLALIGFGYLMAFAASPAVAQTIGKSIYYFANKQFVFLSLAGFVFLGVSMLSPKAIKYFALLLLVGALGSVIATLFFGVTVKGASRWLIIAGISVQPSEVLKPAFVVVTAWLFARQRAKFVAHDMWLAVVLLLGTCALLAMQPDFGQTILLGLVWMCLFFLSGGSMKLIAAMASLGLLAGTYVYATYGYFRSRIDRFLDPSTGDTYQVDKAMDAIRSGGITGVGPGDGRVKSILPDAHADYVFAVAAEEGGLIIGCFIVFTFAFLVWRALWALREEREHWVQLAASGLICLFGLQAIINLSVNLNLMPSKGMTLPFISYGGSSLLASAITMGMLVGLMRRRASSDTRLRTLPTRGTHLLAGGRT
ncbi:MAG: putative peptidoglycan glycosyltransferase FtsW [Alphaproteobacteria bacterium]|nr:putative peptidoglycan glycosyltransferase FtsW [Alphaproteobacteria bacterium]